MAAQIDGPKASLLDAPELPQFLQELKTQDEQQYIINLETIAAAHKRAIQYFKTTRADNAQIRNEQLVVLSRMMVTGCLTGVLSSPSGDVTTEVPPNSLKLKESDPAQYREMLERIAKSSVKALNLLKSTKLNPSAGHAFTVERAQNTMIVKTALNEHWN